MNRLYRFFYYVIRPIAKILYPYRGVGTENVPAGGCLLCANHACYVDPILIALSLPADTWIAFMAKDSLFRIPVLSRIMKKAGAFPVKRGASDLTAMKTALKVLQDGGKLIVFPEGTRVEYQGQAEAKGGVTMLSTRTGVPMIPIYCGGKKKVFSRTTVVFGEPYFPEIAGRRPTPEENRQAAEEILRRIYAMSEVDAWK